VLKLKRTKNKNILPSIKKNYLYIFINDKPDLEPVGLFFI